MNVPKFKIDDTVVSKVTGLPAYGKISGVVSGSTYLKFSNTSVSQHSIWCKLYVGWENKLVYFVEFEAPQRFMSEKEFYTGDTETLSGEMQLTNTQKQILYEYMTQQYNLIAYPEDDLELVE